MYSTLVTPVIFDFVLRRQPVVPFGFTTVRSNPPMKLPQDTPAASNRSPMVLLDMVIWSRVGAEQTSPIGSGSPTTVREPSGPPFTSEVPRVAVAPLVWPEIRFNTPGVEGPKVVP